MLVYCGYIGGSGADSGTAIDVDTAGNAYVGGWTNSNAPVFPVKVGPDLVEGGGLDGFVAKITANGAGFVYLGFIAGAGDDVVNGITVDAAGRAYVTGTTTSDQTTFPVKLGPDLTFNGGAHDAFVAAVEADGSGLAWAGYVGGAGDDGGNAIAMDASGNLYITGATTSDEASFPVKGGPSLFSGGNVDAFVAKIARDNTSVSALPGRWTRLRTLSARIGCRPAMTMPAASAAAQGRIRWAVKVCMA